jgi:hypothetical protein
VTNRFAVTFVAILGLIISPSLIAHHGNAAYDYEKTVTIKGTVTDWIFANPHSWLKMDVSDDKGNVQHWVLEGGNTGLLAGSWGKTTLKSGDLVTVDLMPTKNGATVGRIRRVLLADGKILMNGVRSYAKNDVPTPKRSERPEDPHPDTTAP